MSKLMTAQLKAYCELVRTLDSEQAKLLSRYEILNTKWLKELGVMR